MAHDALSKYTHVGAQLSECGFYRYALWRQWGSRHLPQLVVIGLNPSTADATSDDPTIRRCVAFAKRERCGGLMMVNLYAFRATEPEDCRRAADSCGPDNNYTLIDVFESAAAQKWPVVAAWGATEWARPRSAWVTQQAAIHQVQMLCLGVTTSGAPRHPLYVKGDTPLSAWP